MKVERFCLACKKILIDRHKIKFCSNNCQVIFQYKNWLKSWKAGQLNGNRGVNTRNISKHLKKYLIEKYKNQCTECGWAKIHPITKIVPLEVEHIDGNSENNREENLKLLCPNCHSLTLFYKNLNRGNGRKWRTSKYIKNTGFLA